MNKKNYIAGLYMRLSKDDERHGEFCLAKDIELLMIMIGY